MPLTTSTQIGSISVNDVPQLAASVPGHGRNWNAYGEVAWRVVKSVKGVEPREKVTRPFPLAGMLKLMISLLAVTSLNDRYE